MEYRPSLPTNLNRLKPKEVAYANSFFSNEAFYARPLTPDNLQIQGALGTTIGSGSFGSIRSATSKNGNLLAIKIPKDYYCNEVQISEVLFRRAAYQALKEQGYSDPPIVQAIKVTKSASLFAQKEKQMVVFSMPLMDGDLRKHSVSRLESTRLESAISKLKDLGFEMHDMRRRNIFVKNKRAYIGDCGECKIKKGSRAEYFLDEALKAFEIPKIDKNELYLFEEFDRWSSGPETFYTSHYCSTQNQTIENDKKRPQIDFFDLPPIKKSKTLWDNQSCSAFSNNFPTLTENEVQKLIEAI